MQILRIVKTTVIGGAVFLLPFAFVVFALSYVIGHLMPVFHRVAERMDVPLFRGAADAIILLSVFLFLLCFLAGLIAQSAAGGKLRSWIEVNLLGRVAVYRLAQSVGDELSGGSSQEMQVAVVWTDGWQLAFVVERHADGNVTVILPDAPTATGGTILHLPAARVHVIDVKVAEVLGIQRRMGLGSAALLNGKLPRPPDP